MLDLDSYTVVERAWLVGALVLAMLGIAGTIALIGHSINKRKDSGGFEVPTGKKNKVKAPKKKKGKQVVDPGDQAFAHLATQAPGGEWGDPDPIGVGGVGPFGGGPAVQISQMAPSPVAPVAFPPAPAVPQVAPVAFPPAPITPAPIAPAPISPNPVAPPPITPAPLAPVPPPANRPGLPPRAPGAARPQPTIAPVVPQPTAPAPGAPGPFGDADNQGADW